LLIAAGLAIVFGLMGVMLGSRLMMGLLQNGLNS